MNCFILQQMKKNKIVIIKVYYSPNTEYNPYKYDSIIFYIELNDKYKDRPKITCHSNVIIIYNLLFYFFLYSIATLLYMIIVIFYI